MPLPKIATPTYELTLPSNNKKVKYRPFLVKEEKILIIAKESEDQEQIANAIKDVISNCILTRGIKVETLSSFDFEYLFLNIRGRSVGEDVEVLITCPDDGETQVPVTINLDDIKVKVDPEHSKDIDLDGNLTLRLKYPSMNDFVKETFMNENVGVKDTFELICSCIDQVFNEDESWSASECTKKELEEFIDQLNSTHFKQIEKFFETLPRLSYELEIINPKTNVKSKVVLEGLTSFFA
jgi:citrate lyase gamma subunit